MATSLLFTEYGLSALASAPGGTYNPPLYLVVDSTYATIENAGTVPAGATSLTLSQRIDETGDTQFVAGVGTGNQEVVTYTGIPSVNGSYWVYTLTSPTTKSHSNGDICIRQPTVNDTVASFPNEMQVDPTILPNQRLTIAGGYQNGNGVWVLQYYMTGTQGNGFVGMVGIADSVNIGQGNLHAVGVLGVDHSFPTGGNTNDLEIDGVVTLING